MKSPICKTGSTQSGATTVTLERGPSTVVFKDVPAQVCDTCGESFLSESVAQHLLTGAERAVAGGADVEVHRYEAA